MAPIGDFDFATEVAQCPCDQNRIIESQPPVASVCAIWIKGEAIYLIVRKPCDLPTEH